MQVQQPTEVALLQQQQQQQQPAESTALGPFDPSSCKSLYIGNLHPYVTEALLQDAFSAVGPIAEVKIIKHKATGMSAGYGFVQYFDHRSADSPLRLQLVSCVQGSCCTIVCLITHTTSHSWAHSAVSTAASMIICIVISCTPDQYYWA